MTRVDYLILPVLIGVLLLTAACVTTPPVENGSGNLPPVSATTPVSAEPWIIPADKYVFIDHHVSRDGEVVSGTCSGGMMIDFPMYSFNHETKELSGMNARDLEVNESLKVVYGGGVSLGGALGDGAATGLTAVHTLPFTEGSITIHGVRPDGLAVLSAGNDTVLLPAGETWTNVTVTTGPEEYPSGNNACIIRTTRTETIYNAGIVARNLIIRT